MNDELIFAEETEEEIIETTGTWKILIVDDVEDMHTFTKLALKGFIFNGKGLEFISAFSGKEANLIIEKNSDIALIFLDVVMETKDAGLEVAKHIRENLKLDIVRIIIRTGQPGEAPAKFIIDNYDINDYKEKTELSVEKMYTTTRTALAQYDQLKTISDNRNELKEALTVDSLTGLPNRVVLHNDLMAGKEESLILINIDSFNSVNDLYDYETGDFILKEWARILVDLPYENIKIYRLEVDIFAILTEHTEIVEDMVKAIQDRALSHVFITPKADLQISITIGVATEESENIIKKAQLAIKEARVISRNRVQYYDNNLDVIKTIKNNSIWIKMLNKAIDKDTIIAHYQPLMDNSTGNIVKYETLARMYLDDKVYMPNEFLETARYGGLLPKITSIVFTQACEKFKNNDFNFSINITDHDLSDKKFIDKIEEIRKIHGVDSSRIIFEILEDTSLTSNVVALNNLRDLNSFGYKLSIDDFGIKCSNFAQLTNLTLESIKIDGGFIKDLDTNENNKVIVESILHFANKMGIPTVAEYVHSKEILDIVKALGITYSQGYYLGKAEIDLKY